MALKVYLAAPLFNDRERDFNASLAQAISLHAQVFLPQRDGLLYGDLVRSGVVDSVARRMVFDADIAALNACDVVVAILDGRTVDEGVAYELGFAAAQGKKCIGLK